VDEIIAEVSPIAALAIAFNAVVVFAFAGQA
jgi:hypothetical protein